jgi:2-haloacid dehalogenase
LWRAKQLEYTWVRTLSDRYQSFWALTEASLDYALALLAPAHKGLRPRLLEAYRELSAYPDAAAALARLKQAGLKTAILSNGDSDLLTRAVAAAGLTDGFDALLSVDAIRAYKTAPEAYRLVEERLGVAPGATVFVSSNRWDIAGAVVAGFRCVWLNRAGRPDEYPDLAPEAVITGLDAL